MGQHCSSGFTCINLFKLNSERQTFIVRYPMYKGNYKMQSIQILSIKGRKNLCSRIPGTTALLQNNKEQWAPLIIQQKKTFLRFFQCQALCEALRVQGSPRHKKFLKDTDSWLEEGDSELSIKLASPNMLHIQVVFEEYSRSSSSARTSHSSWMRQQFLLFINMGNATILHRELLEKSGNRM